MNILRGVLVTGLVLVCQLAAVQAADPAYLPANTDPTDVDPPSARDMVAYLFPADGSYDTTVPVPSCSGGNPDEPVPYDTGTLESLYLYVQSLADPFNGYDESSDVRLQGPSQYAYPTRPAIVTMDTDSFIYYIGADFHVYKWAYSSGTDSELIADQFVTSIAVSPNGDKLAYLKVGCDGSGNLEYDNTIYIHDLIDDAAVPSEYSIPSTNDMGGTLQRAGSLAFDYTGTKVAFDANYNCTGSCTTYWSIGILDLSDGGFDYPVAAQVETEELRYPRFAYNNNFVLVMDYHDTQTSPATADVKSYNTLTDEFKLVARLGSGDDIWGLPSFWGGDDYIALQVPKDGGVTTYRVPVDENWAGPMDENTVGPIDEDWAGPVDKNWAGADNPEIERLNDYDAVMPVMHNEVARHLTATLEADNEILDFGSVDLEAEETLKLEITNSGDTDTEITGFTLTGDAFSHNGQATFFPRNQSITLDIGFTAGSVEGTQLDELVIHYGDGNELVVPLIATVGLDFIRATLEADKVSLDFDGVEVSSSEDLTLTLSNPGGEAVTITSMGSLEEQFSHNKGALTTIPARGEVTVTVTFQAKDFARDYAQDWKIEWGLNNELDISLFASVVEEASGGGGDGDNGDNGDGGTTIDVAPRTDGGVGALGIPVLLLLAGWWGYSGRITRRR